MRYGLEKKRSEITNKTRFPVQSSVLDEEALFRAVVPGYCIPNPASCRFLSRGDADIYRVKTGGGNYYLKIYRPPQTQLLAEAEAQFVWELNKSKIPVVKPVPRRNGGFAFQVDAPEGIRPLLLYEEAPLPLPPNLNEALLSAIGEAVARMHNAADAFSTPVDLPETALDTFFQEKVFYTSQFLSDQAGAYLEAVSAQLKTHLQKLHRTTPEFGLCHADLVMSNVRLTPEGTVTLFDFGNAVKTWRAFEFAAVYRSLEHKHPDRMDVLWQAFLQGYKAHRPLPETLSENLGAMLVFRQIGFMGGNCATLPLRLGTEPFETGFIETEMERLQQLVEISGLLK